MSGPSLELILSNPQLHLCVIVVLAVTVFSGIAMPALCCLQAVQLQAIEVNSLAAGVLQLQGRL